jgi:hypothetical protein
MWNSMMNSRSLKMQRLLSPALNAIRALLPKTKRARDPQLSRDL